MLNLFALIGGLAAFAVLVVLVVWVIYKLVDSILYDNRRAECKESILRNGFQQDVWEPGQSLLKDKK